VCTDGGITDCVHGYDEGVVYDARKMEFLEASLEYIPGYYLRCALTWQPDVLMVFAGKTDYPKQDMFDRIMIRLILFVIRDPADPCSITGVSDWQQL